MVIALHLCQSTDEEPDILESGARCLHSTMTLDQQENCRRVIKPLDSLEVEGAEEVAEALH